MAEYAVMRYTAFTWAANDERTDRWTERAANMVMGKALDSWPQMQWDVSAVRVGDVPQLLFTCLMQAEGTDEAERKMIYYLGRLLSSPYSDPEHPYDKKRRIRLTPPWGAMGVARRT